MDVGDYPTGLFVACLFRDGIARKLEQLRNSKVHRSDLYGIVPTRPREAHSFAYQHADTGPLSGFGFCMQYYAIVCIIMHL